MPQLLRKLTALKGRGRPLEPFTVDFDPRWAARLASGSFAAKRYLEHVVQQAVAVLEQRASP